MQSPAELAALAGSADMQCSETNAARAGRIMVHATRLCSD